MATMGNNGITLIKNKNKQSGNNASGINITVTQPKLDFSPAKKTSGSGMSYITIESYHYSPSTPSPVSILRNGLIRFYHPEKTSEWVIYHWSDRSCFTETGPGPFSINGIKTIYVCMANARTRSKSKTETIDIRSIQTTGAFVSPSIVPTIDYKMAQPTIEKSDNDIQITINTTGQNLIAWTTDPQKEYQYSNGIIPTNTTTIFALLLDLTTFKRSASSRIDLSTVSPPSVSKDPTGTIVTVESGYPNRLLSIRRHPSENTSTSLTKLTFHASCITDQTGLNFYSTLLNATHSDNTNVSKTIGKSSNQFILNDGCFYVVYDLSCFRQGHSIIPKTAIIPFYGNGTLKEVLLPAFYCTTCTRVFIFEPNLWDIPPKLEPSRYFRSTSGKIILGPPKTIRGVLNQESPLKKCGYSSVTNKPQQLRISILNRMIDLRVLGKDTKDIICKNYLSYFIANNSNQQSIPIWQSDLEQIQQYNGSPNLKYLDSK